jgi:hypothetical protein
MSNYASLTAPVACPTCNASINAEWQFYFGDVSQLPFYVVGDTIIWGGDDRGDRSMSNVIAVGYLDRPEPYCGMCGHEHVLVDIAIVDNIIQGVAFRSFDPWVQHTLFVGPDRMPYF